MKGLFTALKGFLPGQLPYLKGVYVLGVDELFPPESETPALGLRDGGTGEVPDDFGERNAEEMIVEVDVFVENLRAVEAPVMGDGQTRGLLEIAEDVRTALNDELFGNPPNNLSFMDAVLVSTAPPVLFLFPESGKEILKKTLRFRYRRLRAR